MADAVVGATQNTAPRVGFETSPIGVSAIPTAMSVSLPGLLDEAPPPVRKHLRGAEMQVPGPPQSATSVPPVQPRCAWPDARLQFPSFGPSSHSPTPSRSWSEQSKWLFGKPWIDVLSLHALGLVGSPGQPQPCATPGHSLLMLHAVPRFGPPRQRLPPQMAPMEAGGPLGQSLLSSQSSALTLLHVSQRHLLPAHRSSSGSRPLSVFIDRARLAAEIDRQGPDDPRLLRRTIEAGPTEVGTIRHLAVGIARASRRAGRRRRCPRSRRR